MNKEKAECADIVSRLVKIIENEGEIPLYNNEEYIYENSDVLISIGGDGTFLKTASKALLHDIPVIGINMGTLGLLTEVDKNDLENTVRKLVKKEYTIEERKVMQVLIKKNGETVFSDYALNDCVVARSILSKVLYINLYINDEFVDTYPGDGIIIATQTGSTAYSLSAGGPIVEPGNEVLVLTPLSVHMGDARSLILHRNSIVTMRICKEHKESYAVVDGHTSHMLGNDETVECKLTDKSVRIIRMEKPSFYTVLKRKSAERRAKFYDK